MRTGVADLPLHWGSCPRWLFDRMVRLSKAISEAIIEGYGQEELLKRLADPFWFQAFSCVLGFDWHSSGVTTTTTGALKLALGPEEHGVMVCGGKGKTSRKTPEEIEKNPFNLSGKKVEGLVKASRMAAKVDNSCVQDGYELYHHVFLFSEKGEWAVVQQGMSLRVPEGMSLRSRRIPGGMSSRGGYARRYHWFSEDIESFVEEPQLIACDKREERVLDMTARESKEARKASVDAVKDKEFLKLDKLVMPKHHEVRLTHSEVSFLERVSEFNPNNYEELVALRGMGPKKIRALALISELVYGEKPSWRDPVKYSFAHGGKDGVPFPVDRRLYDDSIRFLEEALEASSVDKGEKGKAIKRLHEFL